MGACLLVREKSRLSLRPALRSACSLLSQPSSLRGLDDLRFLLEEGFERVACALASAPNEMDAAPAGVFRSSSSSSSPSSSEDDPSCSFR